MVAWNGDIDSDEEDDSDEQRMVDGLEKIEMGMARWFHPIYALLWLLVACEVVMVASATMMVA